MRSNNTAGKLILGTILLLAWVAVTLLLYSVPTKDYAFAFSMANTTRMITSVVLGLALVILVLAYWNREELPLYVSLVMMVFSIGLLYLLYKVGSRGPVSDVISGLALIGTSISAGNLIGYKVEKASHLVPLVLVASIADIWSVSQGPSSMILTMLRRHLESGMTLPTHFAEYLILKYPIAGFREFTYIVGVGDLIMVGILLAAVSKFDLIPHLNQAALFLGLATTFFLATFFDTGLPAIPFISISFILANLIFSYRKFRLNITELTYVLLFALLFYILYVIYG